MLSQKGSSPTLPIYRIITSSDYSTLILILPTTILLKEKKPSLRNASTDWAAFRDYLNDHIKFPTHLRTPIDINQTIQKLTELLQHAAWIATPQKKSKAVDLVKYPMYIRRKVVKRKEGPEENDSSVDTQMIKMS